MTTLVQHINTDTWAYFSPYWKVSPNTFVTNSERLLYVGGPGVKAQYKIPGVPIGTRVTCDMEEYNPDLGYHRIYLFPDIAAMVPAAVTEFLKENYPDAPQDWELWIDRSGLTAWTDPVIVPEPEPIPEPLPEPEPEPEPLPEPEPVFDIVWQFWLGKYRFTVDKLLE